MHIKFTKHGGGSTVKAVRYLLQKKDSKGEIREKIEILEGIPELFAATCDSLPYSKHYASAVIAWDPNDRVTDEQIREALDGFKQVALGGINAPFFAVRHDDHLHVLIGRVDLDTGKSYNPAPPGWQKRYDPLRDMLNYKYDWSRPDDPMRSRIVNLNKPEKLFRKNAKELIAEWIQNRIDAGLAHNRGDILDSLKEIGEITRAGKDYISIQLPDFDKSIRLKGSIFEESFNAESFLFAQRSGQLRCGVSDKERIERFAEAQKNFNQAVERVTAYNDRRHRKPDVIGDLQLPVPISIPRSKKKAAPVSRPKTLPIPTQAPTPTPIIIEEFFLLVSVTTVFVSVLSHEDWKKAGFYPVHFEAGPPSIYEDKFVEMVDYGDRLTFKDSSDPVGAASRAIAGAMMKGWSEVTAHGNDDFIMAVFEAARDQGFDGKINGIQFGQSFEFKLNS